MSKAKDWQIVAGIVLLGLVLGTVLFFGLNGPPWSNQADSAPPSPGDITIPTDLSTKTASPTPTGPPKLGQAVTNSYGKFTALEYRTDTQPASEAQQGRFVSVKMRACNQDLDDDGERLYAYAEQNFVLRDADGGEYDTSGTVYNQFPAPNYPSERLIREGSCIVGFLTYDVPTAVKLTDVVYLYRGVEEATWSLR